MRVQRISLLLLIAVFAASAVIAQPRRGNGRISGKVVDEAGKGIAGVEVKAQQVGGEAATLTATTNDKGEWAIGGLASGQWNVDFIMEGMETVQRAVVISEGARIPPTTVTMTKAVPVVDPNAELQKEAARAEELLKAGKIAESRKVYEDLLAKYPDVYQLHNLIARTYAAEENPTKGIEHARISLEKNPDNPETKMLLAFLLQATGDREESGKLLASVDVSQAKDPVLFINAAINYINTNKTEEAIELLTKLVAQFPDNPEVLYYRGRAYLAANKFDEAKADLEKFVAANPAEAEREVDDAKKILEQLTKK